MMEATKKESARCAQEWGHEEHKMPERGATHYATRHLVTDAANALYARARGLRATLVETPRRGGLDGAKGASCADTPRALVLPTVNETVLAW